MPQPTCIWSHTFLPVTIWNSAPGSIKNQILSCTRDSTYLTGIQKPPSNSHTSSGWCGLHLLSLVYMHVFTTLILNRLTPSVASFTAEILKDDHVTPLYFLSSPSPLSQLHWASKSISHLYKRHLHLIFLFFPIIGFIKNEYAHTTTCLGVLCHNRWQLKLLQLSHYTTKKEHPGKCKGNKWDPPLQTRQRKTKYFFRFKALKSLYTQLYNFIL